MSGPAKTPHHYHPEDDISAPPGTQAQSTPTQDVGTPDPAASEINPQLVPDPEGEAPALYGADKA